MIFHSIRGRLQVWHGVSLAIVVIGFCLTVYELERINRFQRIDEQLLQKLSLLASAIPPGPRVDDVESDGLQPFQDDNSPRDMHFRPPPNVSQIFQSNGANNAYFIVWNREGGIQMRSGNAPRDVSLPMRTSRGGPQPVRMRGTMREFVFFTPFGGCILVGHSAATELAELQQFVWWLILSGIVVWVFGWAGGWWIATRALRPINDISAAAIKIAAGDLSQRINRTDANNELGRLCNVLNSTFSRLDASFTQQARFVADVAHDLRTPLSVMLIQIQIGLAGECANEEHREAFEACQRAVQRMRRLIESLLQLARLDAGQEPMKRRRFNFGYTVQEDVDLVRPLAAKRGIEINCDLLPCEFFGDSERMSQVIMNLLSNAIQYSPQGGQIHISVEQPKDTIILSVSNSGPGIPTENLARIFERFYRADRSRSGASSRTGLGLAISKAIVEAHGGTIEVSSQPGAGVIFSIQLPVTAHRKEVAHIFGRD